MPSLIITSRLSAKPVGLLLLLGAAFPAAAQRSNREASPYSRYGIGDLRGGTHAALRAMGGASTAYAGASIINPDNPASYTSLRLTTYEGAGEGSRRTVITGGEKFPTGTATLSYLRVGVPLGKHGGLSFGFNPETRVYYRLQSDTLQQPGLGRSLSEYFGEGATNFAYIGLAGKLKGFSLGVNAGYLFGTINSSAEQVFFDADTARTMNVRFSNSRRLGGVYARGGALYETALNKKYTLRIGATTALQQSVTAWQQQTSESYRRINGANPVVDTFSSTGEVRGKVELPLSYSAGIQLAKGDSWSLAVDYRNTKWGGYRSFGKMDSVVDNAWRYSIGGEFTPKPTARDYTSRITYRLGAAYGQDFVRLRGEDLKYFSVTAGASLPFKRSNDRIHTALEVGRRGTEQQGLARESFVRFTLGLSLIDRWFVKRRYE